MKVCWLIIFKTSVIFITYRSVVGLPVSNTLNYNDGEGTEQYASSYENGLPPQESEYYIEEADVAKFDGEPTLPASAEAVIEDPDDVGNKDACEPLLPHLAKLGLACCAGRIYSDQNLNTFCYEGIVIDRTTVEPVSLTIIKNVFCDTYTTFRTFCYTGARSTRFQ